MQLNLGVRQRLLIFMEYPTVIKFVDDARVSPELTPLLHAVYREIQEQRPKLESVRSALRELLVFLASDRGRTNANCAAADDFFLDLKNEWSRSWDHLPEGYQDLLGDIGGGLHDTVSAPDVAENFESTPEQLLERLERLDAGAQPA
ncbi:MAG: hypothetical protein ACXU9Z_07635 [Gemmatimonadaceae bacterium]